MSNNSNSDETIKILMKHDILKNIVLNNNDYIQQTIRVNLEKIIDPNLVPRVLTKLERCCDDSQAEFIMNLVKYYVNNIGVERPNVTAICFAILLFYYHSVLLELGTTQLVDSRDPRFKSLPIYSQIQKNYIDIVTGDGKGATFVRRSILGFVDLPDVSSNAFETLNRPIPNYDEVRRKIEHNEAVYRFSKNWARKRPASAMDNNEWTGGKKSKKRKTKSKRKTQSKRKNRKNKRSFNRRK